jgi:hypothetical protein
MKEKVVIMLALVGSVLMAQRSHTQFPNLSSPYLGQKTPGIIPALFAPGIVCTGISERDIAISPDGSEIFFGIAFGKKRSP